MKRIQDAVPPMPDSFTRKVDDVLKGICEMEHTKRKSTRYSVVLIAMLVMITLATVALAVTQSGLLKRLFGDGNPPPEVEKAVVTTPLTDSKQGVTLSIDEYLYDGRSLRLNSTVTSGRDEPVYYMTYWLREQWKNGEWVVVEDPHDRDWLVCLNSESKSNTEYEDIALVAPLAGRTRYTLTAYAFTSPLTPMPITQDQADEVVFNHEPNQLRDQLIAANQIGVSQPSGYACVTQYPQYQENVWKAEPYANRHDYAIRLRRFIPDALTRSGLMTPLCELSATLVLDPSDSALWRVEPVQTEYRFEGGRLVIDQMIISAANTEMILSDYPATNKEDTKTQCWIVFDPDGEVLEMSANIDFSSEKISIQMSCMPLAVPPKHLTLVRVTEDEQLDEIQTLADAQGLVQILVNLRLLE